MWKGSSYSDFQVAQEPEIDYEDDTNENKVMLKELVLETLIQCFHVIDKKAREKYNNLPNFKTDIIIYIHVYINF